MIPQGEWVQIVTRSRIGKHNTQRRHPPSAGSVSPPAGEWAMAASCEDEALWWKSRLRLHASDRDRMRSNLPAWVVNRTHRTGR